MQINAYLIVKCIIFISNNDVLETIQIVLLYCD